MRSAIILLISACLTCIVFSEATSSERSEIEPRGKKKKIALFVYFADIILKKIFIFKLIYAFIFWVVIHKAGYFLAWFVGYLKEKKNEHHDHVPHHYYDHHHGPPSYEPSHYGPSHYGPSSYEPHYEPYRRKSHRI